MKFPPEDDASHGIPREARAAIRELFSKLRSLECRVESMQEQHQRPQPQAGAASSCVAGGIVLKLEDSLRPHWNVEAPEFIPAATASMETVRAALVAELPEHEAVEALKGESVADLPAQPVAERPVYHDVADSVGESAADPLVHPVAELLIQHDVADSVGESAADPLVHPVAELPVWQAFAGMFPAEELPAGQASAGHGETLICGYGDVGVVCAFAMRYGGEILVAEMDPLGALQACLDEFPAVATESVV